MNIYIERSIQNHQQLYPQLMANPNTNDHDQEEIQMIHRPKKCWLMMAAKWFIGLSVLLLLVATLTMVTLVYTGQHQSKNDSANIQTPAEGLWTFFSSSIINITKTPTVQQWIHDNIEMTINPTTKKVTIEINTMTLSPDLFKLLHIDTTIVTQEGLVRWIYLNNGQCGACRQFITDAVLASSQMQKMGTPSYCEERLPGKCGELSDVGSRSGSAQFGNLARRPAIKGSYPPETSSSSMVPSFHHKDDGEFGVRVLPRSKMAGR